jgi:hypothetical protein
MVSSAPLRLRGDNFHSFSLLFTWANARSNRPKSAAIRQNRRFAGLTASVAVIVFTTMIFFSQTKVKSQSIAKRGRCHPYATRGQL